MCKQSDGVQLFDRRFRFFLISYLATCLFLLGCSSAGTSGSGSAIHVAMVPGSAQALDDGQSENITVTVANDSSSKGVTWTMSGVGTLTNQTTTTATYNGPASGPGTAMITATSAADTTKTASLSITVTAAPSVTTTSLAADTEGTAYSQTVTASGGAGTLTFSLSSGTLPPGLAISGAGVITGTPTGPNGTSNFTVKVTDSSAATPQSSTQALSIAINLPAAPTITTISLPAGVEGSNYSQSLAGTCPSSATLGACIWSLSSGSLPPGLNLNASTGAITGPPIGPASGTPVSFTVAYTDKANPAQSASKPLGITIGNPAPPLISPSLLPNGNQGTPYSQQLSVSSGLPPYSGWTVSSGSLPGGLTLAAGGGNGSTATISGIPNGQATSSCAAGTPQTCIFTIAVTDSSNPTQTASQNYTVTMAAPAALQISGPASLPDGSFGNAYSPVNIIATGGVAPYTFSLDSGSNPLPAGLNVSTSSNQGVISGSPTAAGTFSGIIVDVTDSTSAKASSPTYSITITATAISLSPSSGSSLPSGTQGTAYTTTISASGGVPPYTFVIDSGGTQLPNWATFTPNSPSSNQATISGTPNATGTISGIIVDVTDSESPNVTVKPTYSLTINSANPCATVTDAGNESLLNGSYVFLLKGFDNGAGSGETTPEPALIGGVLTFNGVNNNGLITAGTLDVNLNGTAGVQSSAVTSGSYVMDASDASHQRACITVATSAGTQHYRATLGSISGGVAATGHMIGFDSAGPFTTGTLRKQAATTLSNGNFAFGVSSAQNTASCNNSVCGGKFAAAGVLALSGGSVTGGQVDFNTDGQLDGNSSNTNFPASSDPISSGGSYSIAPNGRGTLAFTPIGSSNAVTVVIYVVTSTDSLMMGSADQTTDSLFGGEMLQQSGGPFANSALSGTSILYLSTLNSGCPSCLPPVPASSDATIATFTTNGSGSFTAGTLWQTNGGTINSQSLPGTTYSADASGDGRVLLANAGNHPPVIWMVKPNEGFVLGSGGGVESGMIEPQTGTSASGTYAFGSIEPGDSNLSDNVGIATFSGGNVSGTTDSNSSGSQDPNQPIGTIPVSVDLTGLGSIGSTGCTIGATGSTGCQLIFYVISPNRAVLLNLLNDHGNAQTDTSLQIADQ